MRRVSVIGNSGSGKSRLAAALAEALSVPHVELDAIFHQPDWTPLPVDEFRERVDAVTDPRGWVVDGNYSAVRDLLSRYPERSIIRWGGPAARFTGRRGPVPRRGA